MAWLWPGVPILFTTLLALGLLRSLRNVALCGVLEQWKPPEPEVWPSLSVVVPARDEEADLPSTFESLAQQPYPDLEVVLVDDRSIDGTSKLGQSWATKDGRFRYFRVDHLPEAWLGKPHAMHCGVKESKGEWLLFTDADVRFEPGTLQRAVAWCLANRVDHLAVGPWIRASTWPQAIAFGGFGASYLIRLRFVGSGLLHPKSYAGVGAFNLVRRSALEQTEGWPWLRMEIAEDVGLGLLLQRHGFRGGFALSGGDLHLDWYSSFPSLVAGLEKNMFPVGARLQYSRLVILIILLLASALTPVLLCFHPTWWPLGALVYGGNSFAGLWLGWRIGRLQWLPCLLHPLGLLLLAWIFLRSAIHVHRHQGIQWRGTYYPIHQLREGQRVKL